MASLSIAILRTAFRAFGARTGDHYGRTAQISSRRQREPRSLGGAPCRFSGESRKAPGMVAATAERSGESPYPGYAGWGTTCGCTTETLDASQTLSGRAISGQPGRRADLWGVSLMP